jgi:hypothetical protein
MQKRSMDSRKSMHHVAEAILLSDEIWTSLFPLFGIIYPPVAQPAVFIHGYQSESLLSKKSFNWTAVNSNTYSK